LKYPEYFKLTVRPGSILLLPDKPSSLLSIIKSNDKIKVQIINQLTTFLQQGIPEINDVHFSSHGTDLILNYSEKYSPEKLKLFIQAAINLNLEELNYLCDTDATYKIICQIPDYWKELIKQKFNRDINGNFGYRKLYKGLLLQEKYPEEISELFHMLSL
jgi:hypothetical protein